MSEIFQALYAGLGHCTTTGLLLYMLALNDVLEKRVISQGTDMRYDGRMFRAALQSS
jgi:hypothetical protein